MCCCAIVDLLNNAVSRESDYLADRSSADALLRGSLRTIRTVTGSAAPAREAQVSNSSILATLLLFLCGLLPGGGGQAQEPRIEVVDVEIVLAVDASGSIDRVELQMQLDGIAAAFRDKAVLRAIMSGQYRKVSAALLVWSDAAYRKIPSKWHIIDDPASADIFAHEVETFAKDFGGVFSVVGGGTGIGDALAYALKMIKRNNSNGVRQVVDISGDGIETPPWSKGAVELPEAREMAMKQGVNVNGLAILNEVPDLDEWYRRNVIVGQGSFVLTARKIDDYGKAIRKKLLREFTSFAVGQTHQPGKLAVNNSR